MDTHIEFKRKIDNARNILVGAVPSPAGQIDQITYALIYKFMSDIDDKSARLPGGKRQYFVEDYEKYDWHNLMRLDGQDKLNSYRDALSKMSENPHMPELFRSIYQNAFLPFNDPRTLNLFLKEIDGFNHNKSDAIGDAYEYLLSITGAQGDVGQFRTPRHIIKFMVDVVQPGKDDTVLDPSCGTAGFLIAAYNYVRMQHDGVDEDGNPNGESRLTADERSKLHRNYFGYDIDPTMVRTATVNMYLHGFSTPNIEIHDTLTSEEHWQNRYDVILANPPFMTPKGGIEPHGKFGVKANRAEVLFVDYIASHLKPNGRAGIIVPEGIIFQSGNAYKELRKNLLENSLYAVVSLPSGVFNPYAGVKTSILLLDKELAAKKGEIVFIKIENDGYSLGAQRRKIAGDQFPDALEVIGQFKNGEELHSDIAHAIPKKQIIESGDYSLSGERYRPTTISVNSYFEFIAIEQVIETVSAKIKIKSSEVLESGKLAVIDQSQKFVAGYTNVLDAAIQDKPVVAFGDHTRSVKYVDFPFAQGADGIKIIKPKDSTTLSTKYLYYIMSRMEMPEKGYSRHWTDVKRTKIPLPPIEIQCEIVTELDDYQKIIDAAKIIVKTYKPTIKINPDWPTKTLAKLEEDEKIEFKRGSGLSKSDIVESGVHFCIHYGELYTRYDVFINNIESKTNKKCSVLSEKGDVLVPATTTADAMGISIARSLNTASVCIGGDINIIRTKNEFILADYLAAIISEPPVKLDLAKYAKGANILHLSNSDLRRLVIPYPDLETQKAEIDKIKNEMQLIVTNKKLIEIYQKKIKDKIAEVWGE
jgi:type I restriction enzyme M protein